MRMEFQGKELQDYSSLQHQDPSPPPSQGGFYLKTHDFLRPLEKREEEAKEKKEDNSKGGAEAAAADKTTTERPVEHVLPGGIGTYSISHVGGGEPEGRRSTSGLVLLVGSASNSKPEPDCHSRPSFLTPPSGHWPCRPFAARRSGSSAATSAPAVARCHSETEQKLFMEVAASGSIRPFNEEEYDEELFGKREGSSSRTELTIKVDGRGSCSDQRLNTPRSKHSATEQRRRNKINDRFQILRELIPHSDQKRDKASFLLEVIEYIRFLQEKVQKYESAYPEWNQENAKSMPWNSSQGPGDGSDSPAYRFSGKFDENGIPFAQNQTEPDVSCGVSYKTIESAKGFANVDNMASQAQSQWIRLPVPANNNMLNEQGKVMIDEGTVNASTAYSQGLLNTLTQALQNSGVDISQANLSVEINLGKREINRRSTTTATTSSAEVPEDPLSTNQAFGRSSMGSGSEGPSQLPKRQNG